MPPTPSMVGKKGKEDNLKNLRPEYRKAFKKLLEEDDDLLRKLAEY